MARLFAFFCLFLFVFGQIAAAQENTIKIVSWNIEYGKDFDAVLAELQRLDADVYILQEVDRRTKRIEGRDAAWEFAKELGHNFIWSKEFEELKQWHRTGFPAYTGQAVLSRWPLGLLRELRFENQVASWQSTSLPKRGNKWFGQPRKGGRMAQFVEVYTPHGTIIICNTHLESSVPDKKLVSQAKEALDYLAENFEERPIVFAGDLNTGGGLASPVIKTITEAGFRNALAGSADETKSTRPRKDKIHDWIFVKNLRVISARVVDDAKGSDHYPIEVVLEIK